MDKSGPGSASSRGDRPKAFEMRRIRSAVETSSPSDTKKVDPAARVSNAQAEMAEATRNAAANGASAGDVESYRPGTLDFAAQVTKARAAKADAWIAFGDVRDAAEMVKTFKRLDYAPALFFAASASHPRFIALLGQDAEFSLGAVDFDARRNDAARAFAKAYTARFTVPPSLAAAEGYTAGLVLAAAVRSAGSRPSRKMFCTNARGSSGGSFSSAACMRACSSWNTAVRNQGTSSRSVNPANSRASDSWSSPCARNASASPNACTSASEHPRP